MNAPAVRIIAVAAGMAMAMAFFAARQASTVRRAENELGPSSRQRSRATGSRQDNSPAQQDAERLLQRAIQNDGNATSDIEVRASAWRGHLQLTPQLNNLITAGFNANDLHVRAATVQLDLAAMNVAEDSSSVDRLASQAESPDHATRVWALWTLGLLANRGIQTDHIVSLLTAHLSDNDVESRHWAVEALAYAGTDSAIPPLLKALHDDASPVVRERAACGLAQSGMFTSEQRRSVVPTLITYADDGSLGADTRAWIFHALRDITAQNLPDDSSKWRSWYESNH